MSAVSRSPSPQPPPDVTASIEAQLVDIPAGQVLLRDDRLGRQWRVDVPPFRLGRYPVTCAQYQALGAPDAVVPADAAEKPVVEVSWHQAVAFCNALSSRAGLRPVYVVTPPVGAGDTEPDVQIDASADGYRLPTEAEWQYACQAGDPRVRYGDLDAIAWHRQNADGDRHPVGTKQPNGFGLHDMIGNVWEWCWDLYDPQVYGAYRVFRGGGFADAHWGCTAASRRRSHPSFRIDDLGFRLARSRS